MGKKKSVVLMTLITIVLLVLCALVAFPRVPLGKGGIKKWNPVAMQYDLSSEFSGGHYAYYYPNGVITESAYTALTDEEKKDYVRHGETSLFLSTDEDDCILVAEGEGYAVTESFKTAFTQAVDILTERFEKRAQYTGSTFRVAVVDDYAVRVDLSSSEVSKNQAASEYATQAFTQLANMDELTFKVGEEVVDELKEDGVTVGDLIKKVSVKNQYKVSYIKITFTSKGKAMLKEFKNTETTTNQDGSSSTNTLDLKLGDSTLLSISSQVINGKNQVEYGVSYEEERLNAYTLCTLINSAMDNGGVYIDNNETTPFSFTIPTSSEIRSYEPVYGDVFLWVLLAVLAVLVLASVIAIVKMGGFGVMNLYTTLTYFVVTAILFAFVNGGVFVVSLASVLTFFTGLALVNVLHGYIYHAIKEEAKLGKTIASSVKSGYKKTVWTVVDIYAVLLLGAVSLLLGVAALNTLASQMAICVLTAAFCNLVWGRAVNVMLLSASKDKYKYFRFVREDDGDDE